ncbi:MAG: GTPase ObgE [Lentisphaeraceae bacterium]|nr:GTPase ObgE [Lentisphaeraceae bacterium]
MFVDRIKIYVKAGNGGNGCISFLREKYMPKGGPNGGNGGNGSSVILRADKSRDSLVDLKYQQHVTAKSGEPGQGSDKQGATAEDMVVLVPPGTLVMDLENDCYEVADLDEIGSEVLVAQGGNGGRGNKSFATSTNKAPRKATPGGPGEERTLLLELKTIADAGLVGYPNAGKSTLLTAISDAQPKTAPYPFTTLHPMVGVLEFDDYTRMTVADIPGIVEGASENVGLGHHFLRHIERTKVLVYVLDMACTDGRKPWDDLESLQAELEIYKPGITKRPSIIVANKMDEDISSETLEELKPKTDIAIFPVIAELKEGLEDMIKTLREYVVVENEKIKAGKAEKLKNVYLSGDKIVVNLDADDDDDFF